MQEILKTALGEPASANSREARQVRDALTRLYDSLRQYLQQQREGAGESTVELAKGKVVTHVTLLVQTIENLANQEVSLSPYVATREIAEIVAGGVLKALYVVLNDFVRRQI
jgi:hypothetical protein